MEFAHLPGPGSKHHPNSTGARLYFKSLDHISCSEHQGAPPAYYWYSSVSDDGIVRIIPGLPEDHASIAACYYVDSCNPAYVIETAQLCQPLGEIL